MLMKRSYRIENLTNLGLDSKRESTYRENRPNITLTKRSLKRYEMTIVRGIDDFQWEITSHL